MAKLVKRCALTLVPGFQGWKCPGTLAQTWYQTQMTQIYSNSLQFFACLDDTLRHLLPWDIEFVIDESVDEQDEEPEV